MKNMKKLFGLLLFVLFAWPVASRAATARSQPSPSFLFLNGTMVGALRSATQSGDEIALTLRPDELRSTTLNEWLAGSLTNSSTVRSGEIIFTDLNFKARRSLQFLDASLSGIDFPAFVASSKDAAYVTLKLKAPRTRSLEGDGKSLPGTAKGLVVLDSGFRLQISGVDTSHVSKVQLSHLIPLNASSYGLGVTMSSSTAQSFRAWQKSRQKKYGELIITTPAGTPVLTLQLRGLRVSRTWSSDSTLAGAQIAFDSIRMR